MTTEPGFNPQKLATLIALLSCDDLDEHETARIVNICELAQADPVKTLTDNYGADAAKVVEYDPAGVTAFIVFIELEDYFAVADNVDELYEQIIDAFEYPALPEYPYDDADFTTLPEYYRWVDQQLQAHHGKYCLISFGESYTNDFQVILVYRDKLAEILALCKDLGMQAQRCE
ncbi:hypothetical protein H0A66_12025 [Alcaligenaceae bacterium]|nr:hypothetical protein [Alcaligenaceae bacterium]